MYGFFFFQAEDGIRDDLVTGVQTCALPIYGFCVCNSPMRYHCQVNSFIFEYKIVVSSTENSPRSEERRVGKECRSRW